MNFPCADLFPSVQISYLSVTQDNNNISSLMSEKYCIGRIKGFQTKQDSEKLVQAFIFRKWMIMSTKDIRISLAYICSSAFMLMLLVRFHQSDVDFVDISTTEG